MAEKEIKDLGLSFHSCNPNTGKPLCGLPLIDQYWRPKYIQISGSSAADSAFLSRSTETLSKTYDLFVIGESPKDDEDRVGLPFVGRIGDVIRKNLIDCNIDLNNTFLTYLVRCKPPKNRKASTQESKACLTHLYHEIRKYKPKIILLTGSVALSLFNLNRFGGVANVRGKVFERKLPHWEDGPTFKVVATYNPGQFIYTPNINLERQLKSDFLLIKDLLNNKSVEKYKYPVKFEVIKNTSQVPKMIEDIKVNGKFAFDTESPNLKFMTSPCMSAQLSVGKDRTWVIPFFSYDPNAIGPWKLKSNFNNEENDYIKSQLKLVFENENIPIICHNLKYDALVARRWLGVECKGLLYDTQLMHHLLYEYPPHGLKHLAESEFQVGDYEEDVRNIVGSGKDTLSYDNIPDEILWPYGAIDAESTYRLFEEKFYPAICKKPNLFKLYHEESEPVIRIFMDAEWYGIKIHRENVDKLKIFYVEEIDKIVNECRKYGGPTFNPGSTKQVVKIFKDLGFDSQIYESTSATKYSTDKDKLIEIDHPLAENIIRYRNLKKMLSTYVDNILNNIDEYGRVRYSIRIDGTTSGRQSCEILHQIPKTDDKKIKKGEGAMRDIFTEEEGFKIVAADYSQMELRIFAYTTEEQDLIKELEDPNGDPHSVTAAGALNVKKEEVSYVNRANVGKRLNFGVIFGSEGHSLAKIEFENPYTSKMEKIGKKRALNFVANFLDRYPKVKKFLTDTPLEALANGCIVLNSFGRERRLFTLQDRDEGIRKHAEREATNFKIQGPASSIQTRTIILVDKALKKFNIGPDKIRLLFTVHDSALYAVRDDLVPWFTKTYATIAQRTIPEIKNKRLPIEIGAGNTWMEAENNATKVPL